MDFEINNIKFKLSARCKQWFVLPEKDVYKFIDEMNENMVLYDLGACEGRFSIYSGVKNIKTYAFEPDSYNYSVLNENVKINNLKNNVFIFKNAISNVNKDLYLLKNQPWEGGHLKVLENSERIENFKNCLEKELVKAIRLDDFISDNNLPYPDYLKVDIDGNEINFIEGADKTLNHIKKLHIELTLDNKEVIISKLSKYKLKIEKIYSIYSIRNIKYEGIFNYVFSK
jgi:FkbM family methyltransferase